MAPATKIEAAEEPTCMATSMDLNEWGEVENGHHDYILDDEPAPKPKVLLPAVTNGIINLSTVQRLQEMLENAEMELRRNKETADQDQKALRLKMQASADEALQTLIDEMRSKHRLELVQIKNDLRREKSRELSPEQVLDLLEHPVVLAKMNKRIRDSNVEERNKLEAQFQERVDKAKKQLSEFEIQEMLQSNPTAIAIFNETLKKQLDVAKKSLSDLEIREMLQSNTLLKEIFSSNLNKHVEIEKKLEAHFQERIETAKTQMSDAEIRALFTSNPAAIAIFNIKLNEHPEVSKGKITAVLNAESEGKPQSTGTAPAGGKVDVSISEKKTLSLSSAISTPAFQTAIKEEFSFGVGVSRLTTPFRYSVAPLASSPKTASPVVFGASSVPRSPLEVLSGAFSSPNIQRHLSPNSEIGSEEKAKAATNIQARFKRLRDTVDVGGIEGGLKKIRKDENTE
jgi:hypothetical protein